MNDGASLALCLAVATAGWGLDYYGIARLDHCLVAACKVFQLSTCASCSAALVFADLPIVSTVQAEGGDVAVAG